MLLSKKSPLLHAFCAIGLSSCAQAPVEYESSRQFREGKFTNADSRVTGGSLAKVPGILWRYISETRIAPEPVKPVPMQLLTPELLANPDKNSVEIYRLGHSSLLLNLHGDYWLIDPVFGERASPVSWAGPKRYHQPPISLEQLPELAGVIISHDHYDHLDYPTITALGDNVGQYVVPLGVGKHLREWGVAPESIKELDWWESFQHKQVTLTATPAQHFSGRSVGDSNETLWASWVIKTPEQSIFFSGDSGYFDGFKEIGERLGPFDLTLMENGAYDKDWPDIHMIPEQTMQAHKDLRGRVLMPVHNGTFDLALHPWYEPFERLSALAKQDDIPLLTPVMGQGVNLNQLPDTSPWWRELMTQGNNHE